MSYKIKLGNREVDSGVVIEAYAKAFFKHENKEMPGDVAEALWDEAKKFNRKAYTDNLKIGVVMLQAMLDLSKISEIKLPMEEVKEPVKQTWWGKK